MGLQNCQIFFDNPQNTYYSGQVVSGRLLVLTDTPKKLRSIVIKVKGEARVRWSETRTVTRNGRTERITTHYIGQENYFENKVMVFGRGNGTETLPPGEHNFLFSMVLPNNLPSSFEIRNGFIRYTVKATLDRPWKFDHEAKAVFTVISNVDLNMDPSNRQPAKLEKSKSFCCCCCKSGPLTLVSIIPARGFVPGQRVPITVEVDNTGNVNISSVVIELQQYVSLHAGRPKKTIHIQVTVASLLLEGSVPQKDSRTWAHYLTIPPLPPSQLRECKIIDLEYAIKVKAKPEGFHRDLINEIPITIGTIPLMEAQPMTGFTEMSGPSTAFFMPMPSPSAPPSYNPSENTPYPNLPPPSYEECMYGTDTIGDDDDGKYVFGITSYNPRYPTYRLPDSLPDYSGIDWAAPPPTGTTPRRY